MKNNSKDKDISLGRRHYWTDTQGQAHRVVFDDGKLEKPRSTWIVLASVTLFALIFGVVVLLTTHPDAGSKLPLEAPKLYPNLRCARTIVSDADARPVAIAAGWNDEFFLASEKGVALYDASGNKLDFWQNEENVAPSAINFVAQEEDPSNGLLLLAFPTKIKALRFSLEQYVPSESANQDADVSSNVGEEDHARNNAVERTAARGAVGNFYDVLSRSDADIRGLECDGDRLYVADYLSDSVWRFSLKKLEKRPDDDKTEPVADCLVGAPDEGRGYPGLKPAFAKYFCLNFDEEAKVLYAVSSGLFRIDAFNPETGAWLSEKSWTRAPGAGIGFRGAANPISIDTRGSLIVDAESGRFFDESGKRRVSPLRFFTTSGEWLDDLGDGSNFSDDVSALAAVFSHDDKRVFVLKSDGGVDVWE